jgi:Ca-activated chloride channel family protein
LFSKKEDFKLKNIQLQSHSFFLLSLFFCFLFSTFFSSQLRANFLNDWWKTKAQQAQEAFQKKEYKKSAQLFEQDDWKGAANYKLKDFKSAIELFSKSKEAHSLYNKGNALAQSHQYEKAIQAYNEALKKNPDYKDALYNKKIVEQLFNQKKEKQKKKNNKNKNKKNGKKNNDLKNKKKPDENNASKKEHQKSSKKENSDKQKKTSSKKEDLEKEKKAQEKKKNTQKKQPVKENKKDKTPQSSLSKEALRNENEKKQALKHWLEKIPDDPGGLLRRKMYFEYQRRDQRQKEKKVW